MLLSLTFRFCRKIELDNLRISQLLCKKSKSGTLTTDSVLTRLILVYSVVHAKHMSSNAEALQANLEKRQTHSSLKSQGIFQEKTPKQAALEKNLVSHKLTRELNERPSRDSLQAQGFISSKTPNEAALEKNIVSLKLSKELNQRPSKDVLQAQGVYVDKSPNAFQLERNTKAHLLSKGLNGVNRPAIDDLKSKNVYKTAHEHTGGTLATNMAKKGLNAHFAKPRTNSTSS